MNRREFLKQAAACSALSLIPIGTGGWALSGNGKPTKRLIVILLRGAVDGLSVVVPHGEDAYYQVRPRIAIPRPGLPGCVIDLDGHFGIHPALAPILPLWQQGSLAFVQACGSPDPTRSHFEAQDYMENGTPGNIRTTDGWMNRLAGTLPGPHATTQAVSFGTTMPRILQGPTPVANMPLSRNAARPIPLDRPRIMKAFSKLYGGKDVLSAAFHEGQDARDTLLDDLDAVDEEQKIANNGAPSPVGFAQDTQQLARLIAQDPGIQLAFLDVGGWDTHVNQGGSQGQLANHLKPLSEGLASLASGLGDAYKDSVVVVMSEFGRTVHENGDAGTDHGHGNVMWLFGNIQGGKVYGRWPGLAPEQLYQKRDLAITTDFRSVIAAVLDQHLQLDPKVIAGVFPGFSQADAGLGQLVKNLV